MIEFIEPSVGQKAIPNRSFILPLSSCAAEFAAWNSG